jgi:hypothetical protein
MQDGLAGRLQALTEAPGCEEVDDAKVQHHILAQCGRGALLQLQQGSDKAIKVCERC